MGEVHFRVTPGRGTARLGVFSAVLFAAGIVGVADVGAAASNAGFWLASRRAPSATVAPLWVARKKRRKNTPKPAAEPSPEPAEPSAEPAEASAGPTDLPPPPALDPDKRAVAVLPLESLDVGEEMIHSIEVAIMREVGEVGGLEAVSPQDVINDLSQYGLDANCEGDLGCVARAGRYARSYLAIETRVAAFGGTVSVSMRLVDTQKSLELVRVADPISESDKERAEQLHRLSVQLLSPETYIGSLVVNCSEASAEVFLDDKLVGVTPLEGPLADLRAGPHILRVAKTGFSDLYRFVDVVYKRSSTIDVDLTNTTIAGTIVEEVSTTGFGQLFVATGESGVEIRVDGEPKATTPLDSAIDKIAAGTRRLSLRKEGVDPFAQEIEIKQGQRTDIAVNLTGTSLAVEIFGVFEASAPLPAPKKMKTAALDPHGPDAAPQPELLGTSWRLWTGVVVAGIGAGGLGVGSFFGNEARWRDKRAGTIFACFGAYQTDRTALANCNPDRSKYNATTDAQALQAEFEEHNKRGPGAVLLQWVGVLAGGGLVAIGGGLILWDLIRAGSSAEPSKSVGVEPQTAKLHFGIMPTAGGAYSLLGIEF